MSTPAAKRPLLLSGMLTVGDIRDAVQELRDSSLEELRRVLAGYSRAHKAGDTTDTDILAAKVGTTNRMGMVAHLLRAGAKWGVVTIIASLMGVAVEHEVNDLMGWTPPPITVVRQMSPAQMGELSQQILQQLEQMHPVAGTRLASASCRVERCSSRRAFRPLLNL